MIDEQHLAALLQEEERLAASYRSTELADQQRTAIAYYEAQPYGDEEEGRSQVVTSEVSETIDYMTISILRTMVAGDNVVEFEAKEEEDEEAAMEATQAVNYMFMRGQDGYKVLSDTLQSGLVEKLGVVKTSAIKDIKRKKERFTVDADNMAALMDDDSVKVIAAEPAQDAQMLPGPDGQAMPSHWLVEVETQKPCTRYIDMPIPSEEFLFSSRMRDIDDLGYKAHKTLKTKSELIEMGFDRDTIEALPAGQISHDERANQRWSDEGQAPNSMIPGLEQVWLREEYVNIDLNDDGMAELVQVFRVEEQILAIQEVDENPFAVFTPFPRAHRMVGNSLAEKVMDLQRINSVIMRQTLDGIYLTNNPRTWLPNESTTEDTIDDLLTVRPGGIVRGKGAAPTPLYEPFDVQRGLGMMEYITGVRESRTGITRLNQGMDADALNKTATGTALMQAQGQQFEEFIARNFAEFVARLFRKKVRLMIAAGDPIAVKIEGGYKQVEPASWSDDLDVSIRVGLGSGRKDQRLMYRNQLLQYQQLGLQAGLVTPEHVYRNIAGWVKDAALGNPSDFWQDPQAPDYQPPQQQPDPKAQTEQAKVQIAAQSAHDKAQADQAKLMLQAQQGIAKIEADQDKADMEAQLELRRQDKEAEIAHLKMVADLAGHSIRANRPGGSLAE